VLAQGRLRRRRDVVAERLEPRLVGDAELLVAAPVEDGRPVLVRVQRLVAGEARLADPGLAGQEHDAARAAGRLAPGRGELLALGCAADEADLRDLGEAGRER